MNLRADVLQRHLADLAALVRGDAPHADLGAASVGHIAEITRGRHHDPRTCKLCAQARVAGADHGH
jgi:hypothetical protein